MPEYLAPGVYIEEVSFRSKSIEGVSTTTTGFVGPARYGPVELEPDVITSLDEFVRIYGDGQMLDFDDAGQMANFLWHAVRAFFTEGGKRLYVARIFRQAADDGIARANVPDGAADDDAIQVRARFPGSAGNLRVRFTLRLGQNTLSGSLGNARIGALLDNDLVWIGDVTSPISSPPGTGTLYIATFDRDENSWRFGSTKTKSDQDWRLNTTNSAFPALDPAQGHSVRLVTLTVSVLYSDGTSLVWNDLPLDPFHQRGGAPDSFTARFASQPASLAQARSLPIVIQVGDNLQDGLGIIRALFDAGPDIRYQLDDPASSDDERSYEFLLSGGNDGNRPLAGDYEGQADFDSNIKTGLKAFEDIEDISIVAAPGATFEDNARSYSSNSATILNHLISHAQLMRYRIAVLDSENGQSISEVRAFRARYDSTYAAFYYPWVRILDPITTQEIYLPPSGFVAGIYARNDINRAVYKAPANEVVNLAIGFETLLNKSQQDVLNPEGINCFRFFEGRGFRLWGARTTSSDPEWKYVNLRRYFAYLERSIDRGTQWAVFEPNGEALWANVRRTIDSFLFNEWQNGALLGDKPEKAYFVRCDRSTMTQNDLDNGRLVCLIGVAPLRPAEFVIFRIGQWTADAQR